MSSSLTFIWLLLIVRWVLVKKVVSPIICGTAPFKILQSVVQLVVIQVPDQWVVPGIGDEGDGQESVKAVGSMTEIDDTVALLIQPTSVLPPPRTVDISFPIYGVMRVGFDRNALHNYPA